MEQRMLRLIRDGRNRVLTQSRALSLLSPEGRLSRMRQQTDHAARTMDHLIQRLLEREQARLYSSAQRLEALSPLAVLNRGYSAVRNTEGRIVGSAEQLTAGDRVTLIFADGSAEAEICSARRKEGNG